MSYQHDRRRTRRTRLSPEPSVAAAAGNSGSSNQELLTHFECPVCLNYALPPIMQCQNGHIVCQSCKSRLTTCPTCRGPLVGNIRNLAMEKVAAIVKFPCKYANNGCTSTLLHTDKIEHDRTCEYRPYFCPCLDAICKWQGALEQVMPHLMSSHKGIPTFQEYTSAKDDLRSDDIMFLARDTNLYEGGNWITMQSCFGHNFMLVLVKQQKLSDQHMFYGIVQLIGTRKQARNFGYRLEMKGHGRRLVWEATVRSIHDVVWTVIGASDCLAFDMNNARYFSQDGQLKLNVSIVENKF